MRAPFSVEELQIPRSDEAAGKTNHSSPRSRGSAVETKHSSRQLCRVILESEYVLASPDFVLMLYLMYLNQPSNYYLKDSGSVDKTVLIPRFFVALTTLMKVHLHWRFLYNHLVALLLWWPSMDPLEK